MGLFDFFLGNDSDDNEKDEHEDSFFNIFGSPGDDANKDDDLSSGDYKEKDWY